MPLFVLHLTLRRARFLLAGLVGRKPGEKEFIIVIIVRSAPRKKKYVHNRLIYAHKSARTGRINFPNELNARGE